MFNTNVHAHVLPTALEKVEAWKVRLRCGVHSDAAARGKLVDRIPHAKCVAVANLLMLKLVVVATHEPTHPQLWPPAEKIIARRRIGVCGVQIDPVEMALVAVAEASAAAQHALLRDHQVEAARFVWVDAEGRVAADTVGRLPHVNHRVHAPAPLLQIDLRELASEGAELNRGVREIKLVGKER
eukprot:5006799-Prymnesium_polylepis.1